MSAEITPQEMAEALRDAAFHRKRVTSGEALSIALYIEQSEARVKEARNAALEEAARLVDERARQHRVDGWDQIADALELARNSILMKKDAK